MKVKLLSVLIAVLLLIVVFSGCNEEKKDNTPTINIPESLVISRIVIDGFYDREYNLTINGDGNVTYCYRVPYHGVYPYIWQKEGKITPEELSGLIKTFEENNFFELNDSYIGTQHDVPSVFYHYGDNLRNKSVSIVGGEILEPDFSPDEQLYPIGIALNQIIDKIPKTKDINFIGDWYGYQINSSDYFRLSFFINGNAKTEYSSNSIYWANYSIESEKICFSPNPFQELPKKYTEYACFNYEFNDTYLILTGNNSFMFEKEKHILEGYVNGDGKVLIENKGGNPITNYRIKAIFNGTIIGNETYNEKDDPWEIGEYRYVFSDVLSLKENQYTSVEIYKIRDDGSEEEIFYGYLGI